MPSKPLVSVIIIFLNAERFLEEAIKSILSQTYENWELFLVDDGSMDNSTTVAFDFVNQHPEKIRYLDHPEHKNLGMSTSRNLGIRHARGEYIAFLDADDIWLPDKLAHQVEIISLHPEVGMIYGNTLYWHSWTGFPKDKQLDHIPPLGVETNAVLKPPQLLELYLSGKSAVPCTCSILVRSSAIKQVSGFEESFRGMYEDQAFYAKICIAESIFVSDACLDQYRQHPDSNCSVTESSGQSLFTRLRFLNWLTEYLIKQGVKSPELWMTLRQELWLINHPSHLPLPEGFHTLWRWMKKWILRFENRLLPKSIRLWIWTR